MANQTYHRPAKKASVDTGVTQRWIFIILLLIALVGLYVIFGSHGVFKKKSMGGIEKPGTAAKPVPVKVTYVETKTVPVEIDAIGNIEPINTVSLKPQVDGQVAQVNFHEGQFVQSGQLLITLNPRTFQAALDQSVAMVNRDTAQIKQSQATVDKDKATVAQAEAALKRDTAQYNLAQAQERRYANLYQQGYVSREQYDQMVAAQKSAGETLKSDSAAVKNAEAILESDYAAVQIAKAVKKSDEATVATNQLKLAYCYITAPYSGRTGSLMVHLGDAVQANTTNLVSLSQIDPIYIGFSVPEEDLPEIKRYQDQGKLQVSARLNTTSSERFQGVVTFVDNNVDPTTGTIRIRGTFQNVSHQLWPGQFANVHLTITQMKDAIVIPSQAIQQGQKGTYVFVVQRGLAQIRPVETGNTVKNLTVIRHGLSAGEQIVTDGQFMLAPGFHVKVRQS